MNTNGYRRWLQSEQTQQAFRKILDEHTDLRAAKAQLTTFLVSNLPPASYPDRKRDGFKPAADLNVADLHVVELVDL